MLTLNLPDPLRLRQGRRAVRVSSEHRAQDQQVLRPEGHHTQGREGRQLERTSQQSFTLNFPQTYQF